MEKKLTKEEKSAIRDYTGPGYQLNNSVRRCPKDLKCLEPHEKATFDGLNKIIEKSGEFPKPVTTYRGVDSKVGRQTLSIAEKALKSGKAMQVPGITSSSMSPTTAAQFAKSKGPVIMEIKSKKGAYIAGLSRNMEELEVLHKHNSKYKVTGILKKQKIAGTDRLVTIVQMEMV